jgi:hypothetical protein
MQQELQQQQAVWDCYPPGTSYFTPDPFVDKLIAYDHEEMPPTFGLVLVTGWQDWWGNVEWADAYKNLADCVTRCLVGSNRRVSEGLTPERCRSAFYVRAARQQERSWFASAKQSLARSHMPSHPLPYRSLPLHPRSTLSSSCT